MKDDSVIVLNKYEEYWTETSIRRAVRKILNNRAIIIKEDKRSLLGAIKLGWGPDAIYQPVYKPLIIKLAHFDYYHYKSDKILYSDNAVFMRDKCVCQYWHYYELIDGKPYTAEVEFQYTCKPSELTIDHIVPISRGGSTNDFTNTVCACRYCNEILKKNQTPDEAGLRLIRLPKEPKRIKGDIARSFFKYDSTKQSHRVYNEYLRR